MKLLRYAQGDDARLGVLEGDRIVSLAPLSADFPTMLSIVAAGDAALTRIAAFVADAELGPALSEVRLLAPIERPGKYLAIGMNYRKHVEESARAGVQSGPKQMWFNKQTTCITGPFDLIEPGVTPMLDYEAELGVVIGAKAKGVTAERATDHVFGYFVANDVSARDWQFHSPTFTMGKSFDTHGPIGPWIVTADEIADAQALDMKCWVNGELRQSTNTGEMIHTIRDQIAYLSTAFTLEPGDLLATGTPEGVGAAMNPKRFLKSGDVVKCEVEKVGAIENRVA